MPIISLFLKNITKWVRKLSKTIGLYEKDSGANLKGIPPAQGRTVWASKNIYICNGMKYIKKKKLKSKSLYIKSWKVTGNLQKILRNRLSLKTDIQMERTKQIKYKFLNTHISCDPKIAQWLRLQCTWKHSELGKGKQRYSYCFCYCCC